MAVRVTEYPDNSHKVLSSGSCWELLEISSQVCLGRVSNICLRS